MHQPGDGTPFLLDEGLPREDRLLLLACRRELDGDERALLRALLRGAIDWESVLADAIENRVEHALESHLRDEDAPALVKARLHALVAHVQRRAAAIREGFERVLPRLLEDHGGVILLRAIAYYFTHQAEQLTRLASDVDVLLPRPPSWSLSGRFRDHYPVPREIVRELGIDLEFHHHLGTYTWWGLRPSAFDMEEVWERARRVAVGAHEAAVLAAEDNLLYLCHHGLTKGFTRLYRFVDLADLIRAEAVDWDALVERAGRYGVRTPLWLHGHVLERLCGPILPPGLLALVAPGPTVRRLLGRRLDPRLLLHPPADARARRRRQQLITLAFLRPGNLGRILWSPASARIHGLHGRLMAVPGVIRAVRSVKSRLRRARAAQGPDPPERPAPRGGAA